VLRVYWQLGNLVVVLARWWRANWDYGKMQSGCADVRTCKMWMLVWRLKMLVAQLGSGLVRDYKFTI